MLPSPVDVKSKSGEDDNDDEENGDDDSRRRRSAGRRDPPDLVLAIASAVVDLAVARRVVETDTAVLAFADQRQSFRLLGGWNR